ncbi:killer cell lectin-like receptor subfamily B member 1B allele B [Pantherophis guttatus]|uniref:Killer cell lectin-like receptor subfamily B member 1B allele B n=1 Tax=Pantherophis guttatus TaxID=94885 RepID=A0A6P9C0D9_PANGU|nr:killer cell lectin-like receptor subfamily B member 1B allele B [Pantherophis guttatus]
MKEEGCNFYLNYRPNRMQRRLKQSQLQDFLVEHPRCHCFLVGSGCAIILILVAALIALGIRVFQVQRTPDVQENIPATETKQQVSKEAAGEKWNKLWRFLCKHHCDNSTGNLKLCPKEWQLHGDKCYWISGEKQTWNESRDDCRAKYSELVVLKEEAELHFIQHITNGAQMLWIGLSGNSRTGEWLWVDNSSYTGSKEGLLKITKAQGNSCGMLKSPKFISESCSAVAKWICETEALMM